MGRANRSIFAMMIAACPTIAVFGPQPALAVVIGDPAALIGASPPADYDDVGQVNGASGVYIGNGWVLTAFHVGAPTTISFGGNNYTSASVDQDVRLTNSDPTNPLSDLQMFHLTSSPSLPDVTIAAASPAVNSPIDVVGFGNGISGSLTSIPNPSDPSNPYQGFAESSPGTERWGTNYTIGVDANGSPLVGGDATAFIPISGIYVTAFFSEFYTGIDDYNNGGNGSSEAQLGGGDSGGAVFDNAGNLIGINDGNASQVPGDAIPGDASAYASLASYRQQILSISDIPEPTAIAILPLCALMALGRRNRA